MITFSDNWTFGVKVIQESRSHKYMSLGGLVQRDDVFNYADVNPFTNKEFMSYVQVSGQND